MRETIAILIIAGWVEWYGECLLLGCTTTPQCPEGTKLSGDCLCLPVCQ